MATTEGAERTLTVVKLESALRMTLGCAWGPSNRLNPGRICCRNGATAACTAAVASTPLTGAAGAEDSPTELPLLKLLRKYCTPNCSASVNVTSAIVASIATC